MKRKRKSSLKFSRKKAKVCCDCENNYDYDVGEYFLRDIEKYLQECELTGEELVSNIIEYFKKNREYKQGHKQIWKNKNAGHYYDDGYEPMYYSHEELIIIKKNDKKTNSFIFDYIYSNYEIQASSPNAHYRIIIDVHDLAKILINKKMYYKFYSIITGCRISVPEKEYKGLTFSKTLKKFKQTHKN